MSYTAIDARSREFKDRGYNCKHTRDLEIVSREHSPSVKRGKTVDAGRMLEILVCPKCKGSKFIYVNSNGNRRPVRK